MAIHNNLPGIEVHVLIDGRPAREYTIEQDNEAQFKDEERFKSLATTTAFVEGVTGKVFQIRLSAKNPFVPDCGILAFTLTVDGKHVCTKLMMTQAEYARKRNQWSFVINGSANTGLSMMVSDLRLTHEDLDRDEIADQKAAARNLGEITIQVHRKEVVSVEESVGARNVEFAKKIHEVAMKNSIDKSQMVSMVETGVKNKGKALKTRYVDGIDLPLAIYRFSYRPRNTLQDLNLIPRSVSPATMPNSSPDPSPNPANPSMTANDSVPAASRHSVPSSAKGVDVATGLTAEEQATLDLLLKKMHHPYVCTPSNTEVRNQPATPMKRKRDEGKEGYPTPTSNKKIKVGIPKINGGRIVFDLTDD